jgi:uncharacterized protein YbjT (DUF2867 family)
VTNAENEFVGKLVASLAVDHQVRISALGGAHDLPGVEVVAEPGDHTHVLLTMPTDEDAGARAIAVAESLDGDPHVLFIANELDPQHHEVMDHIKASGRPWTIVHPVAMMDFAFAALPPQVSMAGVVFGISGREPVGFVAASDIIAVLAAIVDGEGHEGQEYVCSGPAALTMPEVVAALSEVLGRDIDYVDLPEDELKTLMVQYGRQDPDMIERLVLSHLRAWRDGKAGMVTDTVEQITGQAPLSVQEWFARHREDYGSGPGLAQKAAAKLVKARYRGRVLR